MKQINLWQVEQNGDHLVASSVDSLAETKTEKQLEDILVSSPDLLMPGLKLVGRQTPTAGGPLDLLGISDEGRLVVFELKRGVLTREAVAQVVDYGSYLHELSREQLVKHIEDRSGTGGIEKIEDFESWYQEQFSGDDDGLSEAPDMVLVGLGVDDRSRRMVEFLAEHGLQISLLTFHAFNLNGRTLIARQTEVAPQQSKVIRQPRYTKTDNQAALEALAERLQVTGFFKEVADLVRDRLTPSAYEWPTRSTYTFSFPERTEAGNLSTRSYVAVAMDENKPQQVGLGFHERAVAAAGDKFEQLASALENLPTERYWGGPIYWFRSPDQWRQNRETLASMLTAILDAWRTNSSREDTSALDLEEGS